MDRIPHLVLLAIVLVGALAPSPAAAGSEPTVVFLTRHAEAVHPYEKDPRDPPLSEVGQQRARALAHTLRDAGITRVLSTDYLRTRSTAAPLAERLGLEVEIYDASALAGVAEKLRGAGERIYVAGHSNTTPELVELLGGEGGSEIDHVWEHDRLYIVTLDGGRASTTLVRFGSPSVPPRDEEHR